MKSLIFPHNLTTSPQVTLDNFQNQNTFEGEKIAPNDYIFAAGKI